MDSKQRKAMFAKKGIAQIDDTTFQISSKSNPDAKSYVIDLNNLRSHKGECLGYRYNKECNHIKRLKSAGVKIIIK